MMLEVTVLISPLLYGVSLVSVCMYVCTALQLCVYVYVCLCVCVHSVCLCTCVCICVYVCMCVCVCVCVHMGMCVCVYVYVCMPVCLCVVVHVCRCVCVYACVLQHPHVSIYIWMYLVIYCVNDIVYSDIVFPILVPATAQTFSGHSWSAIRGRLRWIVTLCTHVHNE